MDYLHKHLINNTVITFYFISFTKFALVTS